MDKKKRHLIIWVAVAVALVGAYLIIKPFKQTKPATIAALPSAPTIADYAKYISGWTGTGWEQYITMDIKYLAARAQAFATGAATFVLNGVTYATASGTVAT